MSKQPGAAQYRRSWARHYLVGPAVVFVALALIAPMSISVSGTNPVFGTVYGVVVAAFLVGLPPWLIFQRPSHPRRATWQRAR